MSTSVFLFYELKRSNYNKKIIQKKLSHPIQEITHPIQEITTHS